MKTNLLLKESRLLFIIVLISFSSLQSNAQWKSVRVGGGGAITSIQAHPKVQNLYFITTDVGTPYRWNSTTQAWEGLFYDLPSNYWSKAASGNLTFDPGDATGNVLYATIGATWSTGTILKSVDRGDTWSECPISIDVKPNSDHVYGQRLAVDPNNSNIVYVTTRPSTTGVTAINGTFKSVDAGKTWTKINNLCGAFLLFDVSGGVTSGITNNIFIGCADGVYQTTNGGTGFNLMSGSPTSSYRADIHSNGTMYVTHFKSVKKWSSSTWSSITPPGNYTYSPVAVNPNNSEQVIVGNNSSSPYIFDQYVSNNSGLSWTKITPSADLTEVPWFSSTIGQGLKDFCWDPFNQNMVWFADYHQPFQTTNIWAGSTISWKARAVGEEETVGIGNLVCPPSGSNVLLSNVADVGGFDHKSLTTSPLVGMMTHFPWTTSGERGNMTGVAIQETNPDFIARVGRRGWSGKGYAGHSTNGGATYTLWNCPADAAGGRIAVSANSTTMVWATQSGPCYRSIDSGVTWTAISSLPSSVITQADVFTSGSVFPLAADKVNGNKFYVYKSGKVYVSTDAGATFTTGATVSNPWVTNPLVLETTPGVEGDIWLAQNSDGLSHSTNSGTSFTRLSNVQNAYSVSVGKSSPTTPDKPAIYVYGTVNNVSDGLFRSNNNGVTWETISAPLHTGNISYSMTADRQVYGRVFFNTTGNGIRYVENYVDTQAPTAPANLSANATTNTLTRLIWSPSNDNVTVASYSIYKNGVYIGTSSITSYTVTGLTGGTTYALSVKAKDLAGNLSEASIVNVQLPSVYVTPENIALNKPSTTDNNSSTVSRGNDGDITTVWSSSDATRGHWFQVDLGAKYNITSAEIFWAHLEWIYNYKIEVSKDNITWDMGSNKTSNTYFGSPSELNNFSSDGYRYIRITITGWGNGGYWTAINEFRVFGTLSVETSGTKNPQTNNVRIYPNPATDYLNIETEKSNADVTVLTMNGMAIYHNSTTTTTNISTIPVGKWAKGIYLVYIKDDKGVVVEKVIIQ